MDEPIPPGLTLRVQSFKRRSGYTLEVRASLTPEDTNSDIEFLTSLIENAPKVYAERNAFRNALKGILEASLTQSFGGSVTLMGAINKSKELF